MRRFAWFHLRYLLPGEQCSSVCPISVINRGVWNKALTKVDQAIKYTSRTSLYAFPVQVFQRATKVTHCGFTRGAGVDPYRNGSL